MNIFKLFGQNSKRNDVKAYLAQIRPLLGLTYGKADDFTPEQIIAVGQEAGQAMAMARYGFAVFANREDVVVYRASSGTGDDFWETRIEIADLFFRGNSSFTRQDITNLIAKPNQETVTTDPPSPYMGGE